MLFCLCVCRPESVRVNLHPCVQGQSCILSYGNELQNDKEQPSHGDADSEGRFDRQTMIVARADEPAALTGAA